MLSTKIAKSFIMLIGTKKNKAKIDEIRSASELLRIESRYAKAGTPTKFFLFLLFVFLLVFYKDIIALLGEKSLKEQLMLVSMLLFFIAFLVFTIYMINLQRGKTLIVTEKGLFIEPTLAQFWKDIDEYRWSSSETVSKVLLSGKAEGTSLLLFNNKGALPKTYNLIQYGIFFTPQQIEQVNGLCKRLGIKKSEG
jgi:uncharacterized membrane protein (DUF485 family)